MNYTKSYKMLWNCDMGIDPVTAGFGITKWAEYTPGRCFVAKQVGTNFDAFAVRAPEPIFHFCDNAVDILMWYWEVFDFGLDVHFVEIKPVGTVYKNRANDETALWQCGVNKFEFVRHTTIKEVAQDACREIDAKCSEIIARYPQYNMQQVIRRIKRSAQK